ncbi:BatA domain-containing protein [Singulisphaera sp. PoT]|uniref:BatA domain-containing protein n=1 Tax=Singulisphaera sp. PoT TaxID=3411797 RepID=UPI003BF46351
MSFLQPMLLAALPLIALPIVIHLINQRRYQTMPWAAMMFLLAANRMSRGYARLRQWLIMAFRMLVIATLIFAISRPLAGGWLGVTAGGRVDTTIILLDRSPSMTQRSLGGGGSKLETGRRQLVETLKTVGSSRWVLIESSTNKPREIEKIDAILESPSSEATSASSDLPAMLQSARDYIRANKSGQTEVWICSDIRENDWNAESGHWQALRDSFLEQAQAIRFHLLAYPQSDPGNLSVRVDNVRRQKTADGSELLLTVRLNREGGSNDRLSVPLHFDIGGARSEVTVEMASPHFELKDHRIPLERTQEKGWGRVSISADANPGDNDAWFVFDQPSPRKAIVVAEDPQAARPLELAAAIAPDPTVQTASEIIATEQLPTVEWEKLSLILWQAPLPEGDAAKQIKAFIDRGGYVLFFPPKQPGQAEFLGVRWSGWKDDGKEVAVESWRGDQDLLANTQSGTALPVGQLQVRRYCGLTGEFTPLAGLRGGSPLLARVATNRGGAYFCATTPAPADSSMATGGVVLYVLVQRASALGSEVLGSTRRLVAGDASGEDPARWKRLAGADDALSTDYVLHGGVYASGDRLLAVNRPAAEDGARILADDRINGLFRGLEFARVDDKAGNISSLIQEVWRLFLIATMLAMLVEAGLCLPKPVRAPGVAS